jgi:ATP-dependent protease ClpP protease subunit
MYEQRIPHPLVKDVEWHDVPPFVMVSKLEGDDILKNFMVECQKILMTNQPFLPIVIDSYGGEVYTSVGIVDFLRSLSGIEIITICTTKAMSAGVLIFSAGSKRFASQSATFVIHQITHSYWGKNIEIQNEAKEIERLNNLTFSILARNLGKPDGFWLAKIKEHEHTDIFMDVKQAKGFNLVTHIGFPHIVTKLDVTKHLVFENQQII